MTAQDTAPRSAESYLQEMDERIRDWQLDALRFRRDSRLATAQAMINDAWSDYNAAVEALSAHREVCG